MHVLARLHTSTKFELQYVRRLPIWSSKSEPRKNFPSVYDMSPVLWHIKKHCHSGSPGQKSNVISCENQVCHWNSCFRALSVWFLIASRVRYNIQPSAIFHAFQPFDRPNTCLHGHNGCLHSKTESINTIPISIWFQMSQCSYRAKYDIHSKSHPV